MVAGLAMVAIAVLAVAGVMFSGILNPTKPVSTDAGGKDKPGDERPSGPDDKAVQAAVEKGVEYLKTRLLETNGTKLFYTSYDGDPNIGAAALAGLTLVECGVPATDPAVEKAVAMVRDAESRLTFTYSVALSILFLDRLTDPERKQKDVTDADKAAYKTIIRNLALRLIGNQHVTGGWNYRVQLLTPAEEMTLQDKLQKGAFEAGGFKPPPDDDVYRDNSISQFAILALWQARKHGLQVEKTLLKEEDEYKKEQNDDGSWTYSKTDPYARDATTCAGLICLAIGHGIRDEIAEKQAGKKLDTTDKKEDKNIAKALKYISRPLLTSGVLSKKTIDKRQQDTEYLDKLNKDLYEKMQTPSVKKAKAAFDQAKLAYYTAKKANPANPELPELKKRLEMAQDQWNMEAKNSGVQELTIRIQKKDKSDADKEKELKELSRGMIFGADAWGDLYFLWSLERVAVIYGQDRIGGREWYPWGKKFILPKQQPDGSWQERFPGVPDTCFALLFLNRVNIVKDLTDKLQRLLAALTGRPVPAPPGPPLPVSKEA
jgi:hypothetical protein